AAGAAPPPLRIFPPAFHAECARLREQLTASGGSEWPEFLIERLLLDVGGSVEAQFAAGVPATLQGELRDARQRLSDQGCRIPAIEARVRYQWVRQMLDGLLVVPATRAVTASDKLDKFLTHKVSGLAVFALLMFLVFQSLYAWSQPLMEWCKAGQQGAVDVVSRLVPPGPLQSLLADGIIGGVGAVLVFLPQIAILFLFIAMLEDCGYMARAAFLMDRLMTTVGLSGKSFVPLMSSFACAVPGVMATRVIENRRDRLTTILIAPLMSCSARQPVYALMIGAFIPGTAWLGGWLTLPGLVLFVMTFLGAAVAVPIAWLLKRTLFRGDTAPFVMELPSYKRPSLRNVLHRVYDSSKAFVQRAGTLICATTVLVWGAGYFPGDHSEAIRLQTQVEALTDNPQSHETLDRLTDELNRERARLLEESLLGRLGHAIEPVVRPLGWDWRIGVGVLASFPAREVIVGTLATIYSMGGADDPQDSGLQGAIRAAETPEGRPVYNIPVALSIMVFFALCAQCASTLMVIRRETNSWRWPLLTFTYMTGLAYVGAWAVFRLGMLWVG
ncbi:MAG: ferrous iron transport protein B, partial [Planctomycetales bacterium]